MNGASALGGHGVVDAPFSQRGDELVVIVKELEIPACTDGGMRVRILGMRDEGRVMGDYCSGFRGW